MLKVAILIPNEIYMYIEEACAEVDAEIVFIHYRSLIELRDIYINKGHLFDGIITSGPIGYEVIKKNTTVITPLYYLEVSKYELCKCFFKIQKENPDIDFSRVYIDFIPKEEKEYWIEDIFQKEEEPIIYPLDYGDVKLYEILMERYNELSKVKKLDLVITRISNMVKYLEAKKIPHIFLAPSKNTVKEKVQRAIKDIKSLQVDTNKVVMIKIENISTTRSIFKKKMEHLFKNYIMQIENNEVEVYMLKKDFVRFDMERINLDKVFIGCGSGANIGEARLHAEKAFKKNKETNGEALLLIDSEGVSNLNEVPIKLEGSTLAIYEKLSKANIIGKRAHMIVDILKNNKEITIDQLAKYLNTTERTAGRILEKLEKEDLVEYHIQKLQRGRPKKIYTIKNIE